MPTITAITLTCLITGCADEAEKHRPGPPVALDSFVLHDIQGFWGGCALWASMDRTAIVQVVGEAPKGKPGLWEKRYRIRLSDEQWAELERLVGDSDIPSLKIKERYGVPDQARPVIALETKKGERMVVKKWAKDKNPRFDPLYAFMRQLCGSVDESSLVLEGTFDWSWRPEGFEKPW